jgi:hypothetical protein
MPKPAETELGVFIRSEGISYYTEISGVFCEYSFVAGRAAHLIETDEAETWLTDMVIAGSIRFLLLIFANLRHLRTRCVTLVNSLMIKILYVAAQFSCYDYDCVTGKLRACEFFNKIILMCGSFQLSLPQNRNKRSPNSFVIAYFMGK